MVQMRSVLAPLVLSLLLPSCGDDAESGGGGQGATGGAGATSSGAGGAGAGETGGTGGGFTGCLGDGDCDGGVCIDGACCPTQAQACGSVCCPASEVCLFDKCVAPGDDCTTAADCEPDEYCETALGEGQGGGGVGGNCSEPLPIVGKCLEAPVQCDDAGQPPGCIPSCEYFPPDGLLNAELKWAWGAAPVVAPDHSDVWSTPTVARIHDANCDGEVNLLDPPNVVFVSGRSIHATTGLGTCCHCTTAAVSACKSGVLRLLNGRTGEEIWSLEAPSPMSVGFSGVTTALGDIDLDGRVDILAVTGEGFIVLVNDEGVVTRTSDVALPQVGNGTFGWGGGLAVADIDGDGFPEVAYGATVFTTAGGGITHLFTGTAAIGGRAFDALSTFVDLDGAPDGHLELLAGKSAYRSDGTLLWNRTDLQEGYPGVGDFDADGLPDVVHVANGSVWILDALTGVTKLGPVVAPGTGSGGPPTVADFDGDGVPEIGIAKATFYSVLEPNAAGNTIDVLWQKPNHDLSSSVTGSSVFDFEGDGRAEVIYADECFLWVFDGQTGDVRFATSTTSFTGTEASLVADVDGNGHSELIMVSNGADPSAAGWGCKDAAGMPTIVNGVAWVPSALPSQAYRGVSVFGDVANAWVGTRTIWNQHTYHVSNVCDDRDSACAPPNVYGSIPTNETPNWTLPWLNNFRQNVQDQGIFDAPDAVLLLDVPCATPLIASVSVRNVGLASLPPGVLVRVFEATADVPVGEATTTSALFPGQTQVLAIEIDPALASSDDAFVARIVLDAQNPTFHECREDNNESAVVTPSCAE